MEKENTVKKLKDFVKRLMKDSGIKMSEIVLEREVDERVDYRLKDNDTLPFFHVNTGYENITASLRVRKWDSEEWIEPTVDLLEGS